MNNIIQLKTYICVLTATIAAVVFSPGVNAASAMLDRIDVERQTGGHQIRVYLNIPARYRSHAPEKEGDTLQVQVLPFADSVSDDSSASGSESLTWKATDAVPLTEVEYDRLGPQQGSLIFKFSRSVQYQIEVASDLRSYKVFLPGMVKAPPEISQLKAETRINKVAPAKAETPKTEKAQKKPQVLRLPPLSDERIADTLVKAKAAMTKGDYSRAVQLYNKVLQRTPPEHESRPEALENLGLAREKKGQIAHAKAEYQRFLELYPEGEMADRVRQRLAGIVTARQQPKDKLRSAKGSVEVGSQWDVFGSLSQFWRWDADVFDRDVVENDEEEIASQNSIDSVMDVRSRLRSEDLSIDARFTGRYLHDFLDDGPGNDTRINNMYVDARDEKRNLSARVGRQTLNKAGVFDRFDGGFFGYEINSDTEIYLVAGYPVDRDVTNGINSDTYFYGLSLDLGTYAGTWDINTYLIEQISHGLSDRRALGGEVRYFKDSISMFSLVDYDISYNNLNLLLLSGTWNFDPKTTFNWTADYRRSPLLTTNNAIQGQGVDDLSDLKDRFTEDEIRELALDRSAISKTLTVGTTHQLSEKFQLNADLTVSNLSGTETSGGVEGNQGTGNEFFYTLQLTSSNLFVDNDISIFGVRFGDTQTANEIAFNLNTRFTVKNDWRINPRFRFDIREHKNEERTRIRWLPSLRVDYRRRRNIRFEAEVGAEWSRDKREDFTERTTGYFFNLGYRWNF